MGNATKSDEMKTGRAIWLDTNHRRNIVTLSKGTSACALARRALQHPASRGFSLMSKLPEIANPIRALGSLDYSIGL